MSLTCGWLPRTSGILIVAGESMNIWTTTEWQKNQNIPWQDVRTGLRLRFDKEVHKEVKQSCKDFAYWLRSEYYFPMRVPVYVKSAVRLKCIDGDYACGTFFGPYDHKLEPYIRIATGDYLVLCEKWGEDNARIEILKSIAHELSHYFQWVNQLQLTEIGEERQAKKYARLIIDQYLETRKCL